MGMFDYINYKDEQYQTKDTPRQFCDNYKIESDPESGEEYLWVEEYDSEWIEGLGLFGGHLTQNNKRWVRCDDFDGVINFYREDRDQGGWKTNSWIEYKALFMDGKIIKFQRIQVNDTTSN